MRGSKRVRDRATIVQKKTGRPVQFEITEQTRAAIQASLADIRSRNTRYLFPSRVRTQPHLSTRQYARIVHSWVASAGLDSSAYGTHSMRRTKAAQPLTSMAAEIPVFEEIADQPARPRGDDDTSQRLHPDPLLQEMLRLVYFLL